MNAIYNMQSEETFEDIALLISNASASKENFMIFIEWYFGKSHDEYSRIDFLVENDLQVLEWHKFYNGDPDFLVEATDKLKEYKLKKYSMSLGEFVARCFVSIKDAVELLFMEPCSDLTLTRLADKLHSNKISLEQIYNARNISDWYKTNGLRKIIKCDWN